ncbi:MAG: methionyl-tRNA formyltransferase [Bacteroidota bacterium]
MRIIFMGTPEFAIPSLDRLVQAGYEVVGVITAPDRPAGRGRQLRPPPIKTYALEQGLTILQPEKLRNPEFLEQVAELEADLAVVVAFRMLPKVLWSLPKKGTLNLHAALLPDYRGAAPINWVLINGETKTGATTFLIDEKIDTGGMLLQTEFDIPYEWNAGDLHDHLMEKGADLVLETVQQLEAGKVEAQPQDHSQFTHPAPKIFKEDCQINWDQPAEKVYHFVRGLSPYPAAWTNLVGKMCKIFQVKVGEEVSGTFPGQLHVQGDQLQVATQDRWLSIHSLQLAGKKRMGVGDFLRGYHQPLEQFDL